MAWFTRVDRRRFARTKASVWVSLGGEDRPYERVVDIGEAGLRMRTGELIRSGRWLPVRLRFPDLAEEVEIIGRVAWKTRSGELGLDYRGLDPEDASLLRIMLAHQQLLAAGPKATIPG